MEALIEYSPSLLAGAWVTLQIALLSVLLAVATGLLGAACKLSGFLPLRLWTMLYTTLVRGVPDLVMMMLVFYGGQLLLNEALDRLGWDFIEIDPFVAGVLTIGFIFGAYFTETFRGAFMAIPKGQGEAGLAYGMSPLRVFFRILVPQMIRLAIPGFTNNWLVLIKATALISLVGLQDMMARAKSAGDATREPFTYILLAAAIYLAITSASLLVLRYLERRYSVGVKTAEI